MEIFTNIGMYHFLLIALFLFIIGLFGTVVSKNLLRMLISLEIMFCGVTLNLATFATYCDDSHFKGNVLALFVIVLTAIHIAIGIAISINIFTMKETVNIEKIGELKG